MTVEVETKEF